ncbi:MAG TPA: PqqD family protein [Gemmatimonadaceae bacterium]
MLPVANPKVIFKALSDGAVLFSTEDEVYFGLNAVGARVWELLPPASSTLDELCATIAAQYPDVDPQMILADVRELLGELAAHRLVLPPPGQSDEQSDERETSETGEAESARVG